MPEESVLVGDAVVWAFDRAYVMHALTKSADITAERGDRASQLQNVTVEIGGRTRSRWMFKGDAAETA